MNFLQKTRATIFPKYKKRLLVKEHLNLLASIASVMPDEFQEIKFQLLSGDILGLISAPINPDFKSILVSYSEEISKFKKRGQNFKISGLKVYSNRNKSFEKIELLVRDNLVAGLKISNSKYELGEFELTQIVSENVTKSDYFFPPSDIDTLYDALDPTIKVLLNPNEFIDIEFNNKTYYSFYDMEDGNYLVVDRKLNVYSLIHDATPMVSKMKISFFEILSEINENRFDKEEHFNKRYKNSK